MMKAHPSSFRDPLGFMFEQDGVLYRQVNESCRTSYEGLMGSGLYDELVAKQLLIPHVEVDGVVGGAGAWRIVKPDLVPFISYPYEWSFSQLKKAALTTLRIQRIALKHGMTLRDASAFNVQFVGSQPVFIDTLSFERSIEGRPWVGYRQFCQHFLAPLFLMAGCDPRLSVLSASWIDGIPLDIARGLAPRRYRWKPGFLTHISLHARAQERFQEAASRRSTPPRLGRASLIRILDNLRSTVEGLSWNPGKTQWADYYSKTNYSDEAMELKKRFVGSVVDEIKPGQVVDFGANTGAFSTIAARAGAYVVATDMDHGAVELCFRAASAEKNRSILPLVVDLTSPTPAVGWMNAERASFLDRCSGKTDLVLALALIHHLVIGNNVPLRSVMELLARAGTHAIVEFIEKRDSQVQRLLASREDIFDAYSETGFENALSGMFRIVRKQPIAGAHRVMYHVQRI
jgi:2-polyprenyl-3-methyl-5-hydroxy-6-metoxy-1,4-benzoquinol methylase